MDQLERDIANSNNSTNASMHSHQHPRSDRPLAGNFANNHFTLGAGVAIFHLASSRVVVCYYPPDGVWFLPKGRKDVNEGLEQAAEREGFEEVRLVVRIFPDLLSPIRVHIVDSWYVLHTMNEQSGYRNRLLPVPIVHRQPQSHASKLSGARQNLAVEPVWLQLAPVTAKAQYILHWYIAETVPPEMETALTQAEKAANMQYQYPTKYPLELSVKDRIAMEGKDYQPVRHPNTGVDFEEAKYESYLLPIPEAMSKLKGSIQADVIRKGWEAIQLRLNVEK